MGFAVHGWIFANEKDFPLVIKGVTETIPSRPSLHTLHGTIVIPAGAVLWLLSPSPDGLDSSLSSLVGVTLADKFPLLLR